MGTSPVIELAPGEASCALCKRKAGCPASERMHEELVVLERHPNVCGLFRPMTLRSYENYITRRLPQPEQTSLF